MDNTKLPFIKTKDKDTADLLISEGFQLLDKSGEFWTFVNKKGNLKFDDKKVFYSNKLTF